MAPAVAGLEHQRQGVDAVAQWQQRDDLGGQGVGDLAGQAAADAEVWRLLGGACRRTVRSPGTPPSRSRSGALNAAAGSGCNHTTLVPNRRTSPNVASNGAVAAQIRSISVDRLSVDRVAEREQHRDVRRHLASEVAQVAGAQVVQGVVHVWGKEHEGRAVDAHGPIIVGVEFVVARNPDPDSSLPFLVSIPLGGEPVTLKVRDVWPRTAKLYCHRADEWPTEPEVVERIPVRSCVRRGAAIDLVLDRGRENRSQFVFTKARGREVIFWQSARTAKQARPNVSLPTARAPGGTIEIVVDAHERYAWNFSHQQATTVRRALPAGDYAVADESGEIVAAVERKSLADLVATVTNGKLRFAMAALAAVPRAAVVVEDRYSAIFKLTRVRPRVVADGIAELQVRYPTVPIVFCETRQLAQEWAYRFLGAALEHHRLDLGGACVVAELSRRGTDSSGRSPIAGTNGPHPSARHDSAEPATAMERRRSRIARVVPAS